MNLSPGFNVFSGENGVGKSAVYRGVRFLAYNHPLTGIEKGRKCLLRKGKGSLVVKAIMNDGSWVIHEKGKDVSRYIVYDDIIAKELGGPLELNNFGIDVPPEVSRILGMGLADLSKGQKIELNISAQNEASFMLAESGPNIARWILSLTHLDSVRYAIDDLNLDIRRRGESIKDHDERIIILQGKIEKYDNLPQHEKQLKLVHQNSQNIDKDIYELVQLSSIYDSITELKAKAVPNLNRLKQLEPVLEELSDEAIDAHEMQLAEVKMLMDLLVAFENNEKEIEKLDKSLNIIKEIEDFDENKCNEKLQELNQMIDIYDHLTSYDKKIQEDDARIKSLGANIKKVDGQLQTLKDKIFNGKGEGPTCPLCGTQIDEDFLEHIIKEFNDDK
jgi:DNA repair ATPase RecN